MEITTENIAQLLNFEDTSHIPDVSPEDLLRLPPILQEDLDFILNGEPSLQTLLDAPVTEDHDFTIDDLLTKEQEASIDEPIDMGDPIKDLPWANNKFIEFAVNHCKIKPRQLIGNRVTVMTYPDWGRIPAESIDWDSMFRWPIKQLYLTESDVRKSRRFLRIPYILFEARDNSNRKLEIFVGPSLLLRCASSCQLRNLNKRLGFMGEPYNCIVQMHFKI